MTANANTLKNFHGNYSIGSKIAAVVAAGALALGLSGCDSGNGNSENVNPVPSVSQIDKPTVSSQEPTGIETTEPTDTNIGELEPSQLKCVGDKFLEPNENGVEYVNRQLAIDCVNSAGQVKVTENGGDNIDWAVFYAKSPNGTEYEFRISKNWRDPETFGVLTAELK